jgi:hypothetical protein
MIEMEWYIELPLAINLWFGVCWWVAGIINAYKIKKGIEI